MPLNKIEFKVFTLFLLDLEEILERAFESYTVHFGSESIHITVGKAREDRVPAPGKKD